MNKLLTKVARLALGLSLAAGVGVAIGSKNPVNAHAGEEPDTTVDFESNNFTATSSYQGTITDGPAGKQWKFYYGTPSTSSAIAGSQSAALRLYTSNNYGYLQTEYQSENVTRVSFKIKAAQSNSARIKVNVQYSSDKSSWSFLKMTSGTGSDYSAQLPSTSATTVTLYMPSSVSGDNNVYLKWSIDSSSTKPSKSNSQLTIDDIIIYRNVSSGDTLNSVNIATTSGSSTPATSGSVEQGKTLQLYATANYATAGAVDVTNTATWSVVNGTGSATVNNGLVTGGTLGTVTIKASYSDAADATFALTVIAGPTVSTSVHNIQMLTNVVREDITITTANWNGTPTISALSNNTSALVASINAQGKLKLETQDIYSDASVEVTVSATLNARTETDKVTISVKAPTLTLIDSISLKPKQAAATYSATVTNFDNDVALDADDFDSTIIGVVVDDLDLIVTPKKEGDTSITVIAYDGSNRMIEKEISVSVKDSDSYTLVKDASLLFDGASIIIANSGATGALSTTQNNNNRGEASISASSDIITDPSNLVQIIELEADGSDYYFKVGESDYLYAPTGSSNYLRTTTKASAHSWTISVTSAGAATIEASPSTLTKYLRYNSSNSIFSCYGTESQQGIGIYLKDAESVSVEDVSLTGTVSAKTGDSEWNTSSLVFSVLYEGDSEYTAIPNNQVSFTVSESVPSITSSSTTLVHVSASLKTDTDIKVENVELTAYLTFENVYSIDRLYTESIGETITIYGQFMGSYGKESSGTFVAQDGIFVGNGEYAALVYKCESDIGTNGLNLIAYESYVKVTGVISEYRGLRELGSTSAAPTLTKVTAQEAEPFVSPIIDHTFTGYEDATTNKNLASRPSLVEGEVTAISGEFSSTGNTTVTIELSNGNQVNVFLKANQSIDYAGLEAACTEGANVKLKVFISIFASSNNGTPYFQLVNPTLIEVSATYFAVDFAKDLLDETDAVCSIKQDGNGSDLVGVWRELKDNKFAILAPAEVTILVDATADYNDAVITAQTSDAQIISYAMGRYNLIAKKYATALGEMANFIGRSDVNSAPVAAGSNFLFIQMSNTNTTAIVTIVIISMVSVTAIGGYFFIRRRKEN